MRVNFRILIPVMVSCAVFVASIIVLHTWQLRRMASAVLDQARDHRESGNDEIAVRYFQQYLSLVPDDVEALAAFTELRCGSARTGKQVLAAYLLCERYLGLDPNQLSIRRDAGRFALLLGRVKEALDHFSKAKQTVADAADEAAIDLYMAVCHEHNQDYQLALASYESAIALAPSNLEAHERMAILLHNQAHDPGRAAKVMNQFVAANPDDANAYLARSRNSLRSGEFASVGKDIRTAIEKAPDSVEPILAAAEMLTLDSSWSGLQRDELVVRLERFVAQNPVDGRLHRALGLLELVSGQTRAAIDRFEAGRQVLPDNGELASLLVFARIRVGDIDQAERIIPSLSGDGVSGPVVSLLSGLVSASRKEWNAAAGQIAQPLLNEQFHVILAAEAALTLMKCYRNLNDESAEMQLSEQMITRKILPDFFQIRRAELLAARGDLEGAISGFRQLANSSLTPAAALDIARLLIARNRSVANSLRDWSEVQTALDAAARLNPGSADVALLRASMLQSMGQTEKAIAELQTAVAEHPDDVRIPVMEAMLRGSADGGEETAARLAELEQKFGPQPLFWDVRLSLLTDSTELGRQSALDRLASQLDEFAEADRVLRLQKLAAAYAQLGQLAAAQQVQQRAADLRPGSVVVLQNLFRVAMRNGDDETARQTIAKLREVEGPDGLNWRSAEVGHMLHRVLRGESEELEPIRRSLSKIERLRPNWPMLLMLKAQLFELEEREDAAIAKYKQAMEASPFNAAIVDRLVTLLYNSGRYDEAVAVLRSAESQSAAQDFNASNLLGWSALFAIRAGDKERLLELARRAVVANGENYRNHLLLGSVLAQQQQFEAAEQEFRLAVKLGRKTAAPWVQLTQFLARQDRRDEAVEVFEQLKASDTPPRLAIAKCAALVGDPNTAAYYQQLLTAQPDNPAILEELSSYYLRTGRTRSAEDVLRRLIRPEVAASVDQRCWARRKLAGLLQSGRGFAAYEEALALIDRNISERGSQKLTERIDQKTSDGSVVVDLRAKLALLAARLNPESVVVARKLLAQISQLDAITVDDHMALIRLLDGTGRSASAKLRWKHLTAEYDDEPAVFQQYARWLLARGETESAVIAVDKLESLTPDSLATLELRTSVGVRAGDSAAAVQRLRTFAESEQDETTRRLRMSQTIQIAGRILYGDDADSLPDDARRMLAELVDPYYQELAKHEPRFRLNYGAFLLGEERIDAALTEFESLLDLQVDHPVNSLVVSRTTTGALPGLNPSAEQLDRVERLIERVIRENPDSDEALVDMAHLRGFQGRHGETAEFYRRALSINDANVLALNNLAWLMALQDEDPDVALKMIERAIALASRQPWLLDSLATVLAANRQYDAALEAVKEAMVEESTPTRRFLLAQAYFNLGDTESAKKELIRAQNEGIEPRQMHPLEQQQLRRLEESLKTTP